MINKIRLIRLTQKLIRMNSENPPGDESAIARFVRDYLGRISVPAKIYAFKRNRGNVVALIKGKNKNHSLLLTPHLDTVPAGTNWKFSPFQAEIHREKIYGLGATDCKGNLAAGLEVLNSLVEERAILQYNLSFAATADEECGSGLGLIPLLNKGILKPDAAVVLDSDNFKIIVCQKGLLHLKVKLRGKRAHGAYPWDGVNAIDKSLKILQALKNYRLAYKKNAYLRAPTLNIGTIRGGDKVNIVADWCEFELDFRFLPGMGADKILKEIKKIIQKQTRKFQIEIEGIQEPYIIRRQHPLVKTLAGAMRKTGITPVICGSEGATTISFFHEKKIPAIATGFGQESCAHIADEYLKIDNLYKGALVLERFLKDYGRNKNL